MNNKLYRLVFNQVRGVLMAVAEIVVGHQGAGTTRGSRAAASTQRAVWATLRPSTFSLLAALGMVSVVSVSHAQIVADPSAPRQQQATILTAPNGVPQVNIQTPNAAGLSRNTYTQFDVQRQGVILNNARTSAQTQLGGWVQGNPWLAGGTARVILNEVNSNNPSVLRGYIEVGGDRAQVIVANPAGITCDGCGYINANRATLTTGTPIFNNGNLDGFLVQRGNITIEGAGLDASRTDYTDIIARAVQVNAGIWANDLKVTAGANQVSADNSVQGATTGTGAAPAVAIDVAQLGGMYAGKIKLVGTQAGVGVRNAGQIGASAGQVVITADGRIANVGGTLVATQGIGVTASGLDNNNGMIGSVGGGISITTATGSIDNTQGTIAAGGSLDLRSGEVINNAGRIQSGGFASINTNGRSLTNTNFGTDRGIVSSGGLSISSGELVNNAGRIQSGGFASINTNGQSLVNTNSGSDRGILSSAGLSISSGDFNNLGGFVGAIGNATINAGALENSGALIRSDAQLTINAASVTNSVGQISAGQALNLIAGGLSGNGKLLSQGDIAIQLSSNYTHTGDLQATGSAMLETSGAVVNQSKLLAGTSLTIRAAGFDNWSGGEVSAGTVRLTATNSDTLTNRGLIDAQTMLIEATTLNNLGTGRIYADYLSIATQTLTNQAENGAAPVIAARERLDIGAQSIANRENALIFSAGDLSIGAVLDANGHAAGQALELNNNSATIEALGSITISAQQIRNTDEHFSTHVVEVSSGAVQEYVLNGSPNRYRPDQISIYNDEVDHLVTPEGVGDNWVRYDYTRTTTETQVNTAASGQILSGSDMQLAADTLVNDKSRIIAGATLTASLGALQNIGANGDRTTTDVGTAYNFFRIQQKGKDDQGIAAAGYSPPATIQTISVRPAVYQQNTAPSGTGTAIANFAVPNVAQNPGSTGAILTRAAAVNTTLSNNSLFTINSNPAARFLTETDPRFANYRTWLSSDYLLQQLSIDPATTQTRLGDGFYEQKLVREQVAQLTGRRFLDSYGSDEAQYRALIDNGVTIARQWNLRPGVSLSAEQMAQLTSDIVWLVEKEVTLPSGKSERCWPRRSMCESKQGDIDGSGALLAANDVNLNIGGDALNSGTIAGRTLVSLTAENVKNLGGRTQRGRSRCRSTNRSREPWRHSRRCQQPLANRRSRSQRRLDHARQRQRARQPH